MAFLIVTFSTLVIASVVNILQSKSNKEHETYTVENQLGSFEIEEDEHGNKIVKIHS